MTMVRWTKIKSGQQLDRQQIKKQCSSNSFFIQLIFAEFNEGPAASPGQD